MILRKVFYDEEGSPGEEMPVAVEVRMGIDEAAFIAKMTGRLTDAESEAILPVKHGAHHDIYRCLANMFNAHYENGVDDYRVGERR